MRALRHRAVVAVGVAADPPTVAPRVRAMIPSPTATGSID
jgi:hypothetical protein